jgi:hypothetical protein
MQGLLARLPLLPLTGTKEVDFQAADPDLLVSLADDAETTMNTINQGVGAIDHLLAHSAVVIEDGTIGADSIESLGFLLSEVNYPRQSRGLENVSPSKGPRRLLSQP